MRIALLPIMLLALAGCQTAGFERPRVPVGASAAEENRILCQQPPGSPWYVPCGDRWE